MPAPAVPPPAAAPRHDLSEVRIDRRVELISIVERLSGAPEYRQAQPTAYLADVDRELGKLASHRAVEMTRELRAQHGIAYDAPMELAIRLDDDFKPRGDLARDLPAADARWTGAPIADYVAALQQFAADAHLDQFFAEHAAYFAAVTERVRAAVDAEHPATWFDSFFDTSPPFVVVPGLLEGPSNYGVHAGGTMYQVIGLGQPDARGLPVVDEAMLETLVHEMAHSFVNPLIDRHLAELLPSAEAIYKLVAGPMREQAYTDARTMLYEAGVRAVTVLYVRDRKGPDAAAQATRDELRRSFVWTRELADLLARYRTDRAHYQDLDAYMPVVAGFYAELAQRYAQHGLPALPFLGPSDDVFAGGDVVFAAPATSDAALAKYAAAIHARFFAKAPVVPATATLLAEHPHAGIVAYGSAGSSPVIAELIARAGWKLGDDELALGTRRFTGPGLVLIACWPRPDDPQHGILVYAGARDADLAGINSVTAGGTDWVVARRRPDGTFDRLAGGDFTVGADGTWHLP